MRKRGKAERWRQWRVNPPIVTMVGDRSIDRGTSSNSNSRIWRDSHVRFGSTIYRGELKRVREKVATSEHKGDRIYWTGWKLVIPFWRHHVPRISERGTGQRGTAQHCRCSIWPHSRYEWPGRPTTPRENRSSAPKCELKIARRLVVWIRLVPSLYSSRGGLIYSRNAVGNSVTKLRPPPPIIFGLVNGMFFPFYVHLFIELCQSRSR